jgi:hypothetical protein
MKLKINFILSVALFASTFSSYGQSFNFANPIRVDSVVDYDYINKEWVFKTKRVFSYKPDSNMIKEILYEGGSTIISNYFIDNNIVKRNINYDNFTKFDSVIYENGKIIKQYNNIFTKEEIIYLYDNNILEIYKFIYGQKNKLEKFNYNLDNKLSEYDEYFFNELGDTSYHNKKEYYYKENGNIEIFHYSIIDNSLNLVEKTVQFFDNGSHTKTIIYSRENESWVEAEMIEYTYDPLLPKFKVSEFIDYSATEVVQYSWNKEINDWVPFWKSKLFYSKHNLTNSVKPVSTPSTVIYPNPVIDRIRFKFEDSYTPFIFELSDLNGKNVITQKFSGNEQISLETLAKGVYIYKITNGKGEIKSGKLIKN